MNPKELEPYELCQPFVGVNALGQVCGSRRSSGHSILRYVVKDVQIVLVIFYHNSHLHPRLEQKLWNASNFVAEYDSPTTSTAVRPWAELLSKASGTFESPPSTSRATCLSPSHDSISDGVVHK